MINNIILPLIKCSLNFKTPMSANRKILLNPGPGTTSQRVKDFLIVDDICLHEIDFGNLETYLNESKIIIQPD